MQPITRGIQAVGSVSINYKYNSVDGVLPVPSGWDLGGITGIDTSPAGIELAGFRLDGEFLRAAQQIASSIMVPILGGGGVALTNNNRTGTLTIASSRVSSPNVEDRAQMTNTVGNDVYYDLVLIAQCQQAALGGDSVGATLTVKFDFNGLGTTVEFQGVTVANVAPLALAGNDVANYAVSLNYLNWKASFSNGPIAT